MSAIAGGGAAAEPSTTGSLSVVSGAALYVGSLIGPGVLLVPSLAVRAAGPGSVISWGILLILSAPLAAMFGALGIRMPVAGGVAEYARTAFGRSAGQITGGWFLTAVLIGAPTVAMMGGLYVADLAGSGHELAGAVALTIFAAVLCSNAFGLRASAKVQMAVAAVLTVLIALAVSFALPHSHESRWTPFAPHGWWAIGTAGNVLIWLFVGWESVAQLTGEFQNPRTQLPRAIGVALVTIAILYCALAVATVGVGSRRPSSVPLADLMGAGLGPVGRRATAVLAVALTMATMNVYLASAARLAGALARSGGLPAWLSGDPDASIPRRPLLVIGSVGLVLLLALTLGLTSTTVLVRATAACFVAVYVAATASAVRILRGRLRLIALPTALLVTLLGVFSTWYLIVPAISGVLFAAVSREPPTSGSSLA